MQTEISGNYVTVEEAARLAGLQTISVYSAIRRGTLPAIRIGRRALLVRKSDVDRFLRR
jgi:excisionase family DNA binding protein